MKFMKNKYKDEKQQFLTEKLRIVSMLTKYYI